MRESLAAGVVLGTGLGVNTTLGLSGLRYNVNTTKKLIDDGTIRDQNAILQNKGVDDMLPSYQQSLLAGAAVGAATFGATATGLYAYHAMAGNVRY